MLSAKDKKNKYKVTRSTFLHFVWKINKFAALKYTWMEITIVNIIQAMLAPGIMISACGLLLLGMNNKYSLVISRIRALDDEKRKLKVARTQGTITKEQESRLSNIEIQTSLLVKRIKIVRNAVLGYSTAVALFIVTCLTIGLQYAFESVDLRSIIIILFLSGMLSVFVGIIHAAHETIRGYRIVQIETKD
jgi:hypothetical protein